MNTVQLLTSREAIGVYALILAAVEKKFQFIKPAVKYAESHTGVLKTVENDVKALGDTAAGKVVETKLHSELNGVIDDLKKSALAQWTQAAMRGAKKGWDELSPSEQGAAISFVQHHLPAKVQATESEIAKAFQNSPQLAQLFAGDAAFQKAQEFTALLSKANTPDTPAVPSTPTQPANTSPRA